jgi:MFS family permease
VAVPNLLRALRFRDFRLLWSGLIISNLGTWMQFTSLGYSVSMIAGTPQRAALYLGFMGAARAIPVLLLSPVAGVVADTQPRRRVLMAANVTMSAAALAFALLATTHHLTLAAILIISAVNAVGNAFDSPVRQSWTPLLVDRAYVGNAIGLTSVAFNAPAVIGPVIAGLLIVWVGVAGSFYFNAVATLAVVVVLTMMHPSRPTGAKREPILDSIAEGLAFLWNHPVLKWIIGVFFVTAIFVRPYAQLSPAYIINTLHGDARELSWAIAAVGVGGFIGALVTAGFSGERRSVQWIFAGVLMTAGVATLGFIRWLPMTYPVFFLIGLGTLSFLGACNTLIQMLSPDAMRGRAVSIYTMVAMGVVPGGSLVLGSIAAVVGLHLTFIIAGGSTLALLCGVYWLNPQVRAA